MMPNAKAKVLLVEDDPSVLRMLERQLVSKGYEAFPCPSPGQVLRFVREKQPDVVLMDAHLPGGVSGLDLCSELQQDPSLRCARVIVMSGKPEYLKYQSEAQKRGAIGFLQKPFVFNELNALLSRALAKKTATLPPCSNPPAPVVLCVEDEESYRDILSLALLPAGIRCEFAPTLKGARELLKGRQYDLILLDASLPDGSGLDLCRELRWDAPQKHWIFVLTGQKRVVNRNEWFEAGADQCYPKVFDVEKLRQLVQAHLRRRRWDSPAICPAKGIDFDQIQRIVIYHGEPSRTLSVKEWQFLSLLCADPGALVTRQRIHSEILCYHGGSDAELALNTFILHFRKKLPPKLADVLQTVKGEGYRLVIG